MKVAEAEARADVSGVLRTEPLSRSLGYLLRRLQLTYKKHFTHVAGPNGIQPNHVGALMIIGLNPGIAPAQLITSLGMDGAQVTAVLNALEAKKLIARKSSKTDGRSRTVHLTAAGRREFETVQEIAWEAERSFIGSSLNKDETATLINLLSRVLAGRAE